jgi:hypothetical protein
MVPLLASVYRAFLGQSNFTLWLSGPSGCFKSELANLMQWHWGPEFSVKGFAANWEDTANAIERTRFIAADALIVADDFVRNGGPADQALKDRMADRVVRGQGNGSGRGRCAVDGSLRENYPPRGSLLVTGETLPHVASLLARLLDLAVSLGDVDMNRLTDAQGLGRCGQYAKAGAGYVRWLAGQREAGPLVPRQEVEALRANYPLRGVHNRTVPMLIDLEWGFRQFVRFAVEAQAISQGEAEVYLAYVVDGLRKAGSRQADLHAETNPITTFFDELRSAIATGLAHVADQKGECRLITPEAWGWRRRRSGASENDPLAAFEAQGRQVGWLAADNLYLDPQAAFDIVNHALKARGESLGVSVNILGRRLKEGNYLVGHEAGNGGRGTVQRRLSGQKQRVWHLPVDKFLLGVESCPVEEPGATDEPGAA